MTTFSDDVEQWRSKVDDNGCEMPTDFVLAFIEHESGGNPCSTGIPGKEAGIGQIFFDVAGSTVSGATFAQLRKGCSGQTVTDRSAVDDDAQVSSTCSEIDGFTNRSSSQLADVGADWNGLDFAKLVKMQHNLPAIPKSLLPSVTSDLGRAPADWDEWKEACLALTTDQLQAIDSALPRFAGEFQRLFANAEAVAARSGIDPSSSASVGGLFGAQLAIPTIVAVFANPIATALRRLAQLLGL